MSVALQPSSALGFNRPLTTHVKRSLQITNNNAQPVAFKVKTTAPKLYCVRPNSGRVDPGETVEVQVMLQAMKEEPPLSTKCKDKFLIQSTTISADKETLPLHDIWNNVDPESPVQSQKIRVVYLPPEGQTVPEEDEAQPVEGPAAVIAPAPVPESKLFTTAPRAANGGAPPIPDFDETRAADVEQHGDYEETQEEMPAAEAAPVVNVAVHPPPREPSPPSRRIPSRSHDDDMDAKLAEASAEISRLRALLVTMPEPSKATSTQASSELPELRRRHRPASTVIGSETDVSSYVDEPLQPDGVPLQIVIIIALGVFVTTYLFF